MGKKRASAQAPWPSGLCWGITPLQPRSLGRPRRCGRGESGRREGCTERQSVCRARRGNLGRAVCCVGRRARQVSLVVASGEPALLTLFLSQQICASTCWRPGDVGPGDSAHARWACPVPCRTVHLVGLTGRRAARRVPGQRPGPGSRGAERREAGFACMAIVSGKLRPREGL